MSDSPVAAVMVHVADVVSALIWYQRAFPTAARRVAPGADFEFLQVGNVQLEFFPADEKVRAGPAGSVVYWHVASLNQAFLHFTELGASMYRGPMQIEDRLGMCQVLDPWGNCIGLRGLYEFQE